MHPVSGSLPGQLVDVGGHRLHAVVHRGSGPVVVMEAGLSLNCLSWLPLLAALGPEVSSVAYDRACNGWSDHARTRRTSSTAVADLKLLLERLELNAPYVLVGHSLGAQLAGQFAITHPELVAGLIYVDGAPHRQRAVFAPPTRTQRTRANLSWWWFRRRTLTLAWLGKYRSMSLGTGEASWQQWATVLAEDRPASSVEWLRCEVPLLAKDLEGSTPPLPDRPLRVLWAEPDAAAPGWDLEYTRTQWRLLQEELAASSSQGSQQVIPDAGHAIQLSHPERVAQAIHEVMRASTS